MFSQKGTPSERGLGLSWFGAPPKRCFSCWFPVDTNQKKVPPNEDKHGAVIFGSPFKACLDSEFHGFRRNPMNMSLHPLATYFDVHQGTGCMAVGQHQWDPIFRVGAPPILEPILVVGLGCSLGGSRGFNPQPYPMPLQQGQNTSLRQVQKVDVPNGYSLGTRSGWY